MIILTDADGTLYPATLGSNAIYTDEMMRNLHSIYASLPPLGWTRAHKWVFEQRAFVVHTGRERRFNDITRESVKKHFGIEHLDIVNVDFGGSHDRYIENKIKAIHDLVDCWKGKKHDGEPIMIVDDDQDVIRPVSEHYRDDGGVAVYTVIDGRLNAIIDGRMIVM